MKGWSNLGGRSPSARSQAGMSLVEATIILMVLALLTSVIAPSMQDYIDDARRTKAKEDCEAIGTGIWRVLRDTGAPFLYQDGDLPLITRTAQNNRVDLAVSMGDIPGILPAPTIPGPVSVGNITIVGALTWESNLNGSTIGALEDHLVTNQVQYVQPTVGFATNAPAPPRARGIQGFGWRGAYVSPIIGPDPWGFRYAVNSVYLGTGNNSNAAQAGQHGVGWAFDTICISAGSDNNIETNFEDTLLASGGGQFNQGGGTNWPSNPPNSTIGDDIIYVLSGYGK